MIQFIILTILVVILYCLSRALFFMVRGKGNFVDMAKALSWRIALSLALFVFLFVAFAMGWLVPHAILAR